MEIKSSPRLHHDNAAARDSSVAALALLRIASSWACEITTVNFFVGLANAPAMAVGRSPDLPVPASPSSKRFCGSGRIGDSFNVPLHVLPLRLCCVFSQF